MLFYIAISIKSARRIKNYIENPEQNPEHFFKVTNKIG